MKSKKKAPVVTPPSRKHPNVMRENEAKTQGKGPFAPTSKKRFSK